jgi:flagellin-like protein
MRTLGKAKKGISPVIATIILIAITIVIAIAVAAWVFGLFKSYTGGPAVTINAAQSSCQSNGQTCTLVVSNQGGNSVTVVGATVNGVPWSISGGSVTVSAGAASVPVMISAPSSSSFTAGQTLTITLQLNTGSTVTTTIVAS